MIRVEVKDKKFLKTDDNKIINIQHIRGVKKMNDCLEVGVKSIGCNSHNINERNRDTHKICKLNSFLSYVELNQHFEKESGGSG